MTCVIKRVVLDTSTLVGVVLKPNSLPAQVFYDLVENHILLASKATLQELSEVLQRDKFDRFRSRQERATVLAHYLHLVEIISITANVEDCRDPKDNKFLELALSGNANLIITSDDDLRVLDPYQGIPIITARDYSERYQSK